MNAKAMVDNIRDKIHLHGAFQRIFDNPENPDGQLVLREILRQGFVTRSTFVAGDPHQTAMNEGSRRLALSILKHSYRDHARLVEQLTEAMKE